MVFATIAGYLIVSAATLVTIVIAYFKWSYQYFERKNIPYLKPQFPFGNFAELLKGKEYFGLSIKRLYDQMKQKGWKQGGMFTFATPSFMALDLDLIRNILTKDFQYFVDRNTFSNEKHDPISAHLVNITGNRWKNLRSKLTPTFTSGKLKIMFHTLIECEQLLHKRMEKIIESHEPIDIKNVVACFTTDVIGSCAFGLDCKAIENDDSPFRVYGRKAINFTRGDRFKRSFASNFPKLAKMLRIVTTNKEVSAFFMKMVKDTVNYRERNNIKRNDFLQMLIDLKNKDSEEEALTMNEVAAQSFVFFLGGFETSSTLMSFALYELSRYQDIQDRARSEIHTVLGKYDGKITYEAIQDMKYLSQVLDETLRLHPPAPATNRKCQKDYKIPGEDIIIEKGISVFIPITGIHYDPDYYPEPKKFDPDRFSDENKALRHNYTFLPFGEGPRNCIGMRFGLMQAKVGLATLLNRYKFTVNRKTIEPIQIKPSGVILSALGEIWLNAEKI